MLRLQSPPPPPISPLPISTSLFFITCIFPSPILPVLYAVSKIDKGLLCILVHVGMVARVCSLSICLGCQGVSWVPACLLLNIYHSLNVVAPPRELDSASNTSHPLLLSFSLFLFYTAFCRYPCFFMFLLFLCGACHAVFSGTLCLCHTCLWLSRLPYLNPTHTSSEKCVYPCLLPFCFNQPWTSRLKLLHYNHPWLFPNPSCFRIYAVL